MQVHQCKAPNSGCGGPASTSQAALSSTAASGSVRRPAARNHGRCGNGCSWHAGQQPCLHGRILRASASKGFGDAPKKAPQPALTKPGKDARARIDFQDLMIVWDKTLEHLYEDPDVAETLLHTAQRGHRQQGRGCVFVRAEVADRFSKRKANAVSQPGTLLSCDADLLLGSWTCDFIPAGELQQLGGIQAAGRNNVAVPMAADLIQQGSSMELLAELQRAMRGMDPQQLRVLVGIDAGSAAGAEPTTAAVASSASRPYDPVADELAVLLFVRVNGIPAIGADLARSARSRAGDTFRLVSDELPEEWQ